MYNGLKYVLTFSLGAAIGSVVTWGILKRVCERRIQDEVAEFKEYWANKDGLAPVKEEPVEESKDEPTTKDVLDEYIEVVDNYRSKEEGGSNSMDNIGPQVIPPEECGEIEEYDVISLTYYADGVLTDDMNEPIENIEETVGYSFAEHFGEYEDDSVFIRNHRLKCDYEILKVEDYYDIDAVDENPNED